MFCDRGNFFANLDADDEGGVDVRRFSITFLTFTQKLHHLPRSQYVLRPRQLRCSFDLRGGVDVRRFSITYLTFTQKLHHLPRS